MKEFRYKISDRMGLHAQPAGFLVKKASAFPCKITVVKGEKTADAKKIFAVMGLSVKCGEEILLRAEGDGEEKAIMVLGEFFRKNL